MPPTRHHRFSTGNALEVSTVVRGYSCEIRFANARTQHFADSSWTDGKIDKRLKRVFNVDQL
jgi:hypothetical protein